jgi:hypothetical protein
MPRSPSIALPDSDRAPWAANTDPPVNKRDLSTGENGELDSETLASNTDPGGSCWTPGNPSFQLEKTGPPSTREMLGITAARGRAEGRWLPKTPVFQPPLQARNLLKIKDILN